VTTTDARPHGMRREERTADAPFARPTSIPGVLLLAPKVHRDPRGFFRELWHEDRYADAGITTPFVQDNVSYSERGVLRGMHYQHPAAQGKLVTAVLGHVYDVVVDVRAGSPTFGRWEAFYVPAGLAHGFLVRSAVALFAYKCTTVYAPALEHVLRWDDPDVGIEWPTDVTYTVSPRDAAGRRLRDLAPHQLPVWA